jgi:hypothetical protein
MFEGHGVEGSDKLVPDIDDNRELGPLSDSKPTLACQLRSSLRMSPLKCALDSGEGDRPMSLVWQLETPPPARLFREFSVLPNGPATTSSAPCGAYDGPSVEARASLFSQFFPGVVS